jgi:precorrin-2 dehydrogenase/sirohydrochlorin ferrochelatase
LLINFKGKKVLIVGGGKVALRKARTFSRAGARVVVASREFTAGFSGMPVERVRLKSLEYPRSYSNAFLVIAATDDKALNASISSACRRAGVMCNSVDDLDSEVYMAASISRGPLSIWISTRGASPGLSKMARKEIEKGLGPEWGAMAVLQSEVRAELKKNVRSQAARSAILTEILGDGHVWSLLRSGNVKGARLAIKRHMRV